MSSLNHSRGRMQNLLLCGVVLGPLFYAVVVLQLLTRSGFDITRHPLSLLALGGGGWIQTANFVITGILAIGCAFGLRLRLAGGRGNVSVPLLVGAFGLGLITAAVFRADPAFGFPPGTPNGIQNSLSGSAALHGVGFLLAFGSLMVACFVLAMRFRQAGRTRWALYSMVTGATIILVVLAGMVIPLATSLLFFLAGIIAFGWLAAVSMRFRSGVGAHDSDSGAAVASGSK